MAVISADAASPSALEEAVAAAERSLARKAFEQALDAVHAVRDSSDETRLALRIAAVEGAAQRELGDVDAAATLLERVRARAEQERAPERECAALLYGGRSASGLPLLTSERT